MDNTTITISRQEALDALRDMNERAFHSEEWQKTDDTADAIAMLERGASVKEVDERFNGILDF